MSKKNIEDTYALSPLQQGMLFHEVDEPGAYFVQITCTLHGEIDLDLFRKAWQQVSDRTPVLRSAFVWKTTKKPLQLVGRRVRVPFSSEDWSDLSRDEQASKLEELLRADREQGIELGRAPLIRITAVRRAADEVFFLWSLSHLILDGWSYPMVLEEVLEHYQAAAAGRPPRVGKRRPFRDYIGWLQRQDMAAAEAFWREQLGDVTAPTALGVDRHQSVEADHRGDGHEETVELPEELTAELNAFTPRHQLTLNTLVEGAWALMLARYSGEKSIVFGAIGSGRPADLPGVEEMIGLFLNTLPVRTRIDDRQPVLEWLGELQSHRLAARQYEFTPLAKIQQWSGVGGGQPLFESSVSFQSYPLDESLAEGSAELAVSDFNIGEEASFPLLLGSMPGPRLPLIVEYQRSRFDDATIHRMLGHLHTLLAEIAAKPGATVGELSLLTATERTQLLEEWSGELGPYPDRDTVHSLVFGAGAEDPQAPAVLCGEVTLSHGELAAASAALARKIVATGATPGTLVGLCVQRSERLVVGLMGILQAGCAYVPLDPAYPADRLAYMVEDSSAPLVVTEAGAVGQLPEATGKILLDELMEEDGATVEPDVALPDVSPDQLAYVIYTSGSTGKPKGVMISHRMVVQYTVEMVRQFGLDASDRVLQFASLSFDVVVEEVYPALAAGAAVVVPSQDLLLSTAELERQITDHGVTGLELPAAYWQEWVHAMVQAARTPPESLRWILVGCEKPQQERLASWRQWNIPLYIVFGLTETTVTSTLFRLEGEVPGELPVNLDLPIGKPVVNSRVWVLDDRLEPVPVGVTGQLYIGGLGVGRGYLGRPALTAERFGPDPLSNLPGERWYRTGDLARWRENGDLEFLGRMDHQVKVRGFRVELGEIEQALGDHPGVREAAVVAHTPAGAGGTRLVGYVVYEEDAQEGAAKLGAADLRAYLKERLPEYMVPASLVELGSLPLTPNGKVDRDALPAPGSLSRAGEQGYEPPRNETEKALAEVWSEVLGVESVGIHDDFFELGGDSILSIQLTTRARKAGVEINPRQVFENPTIAQLAKVSGQGSKVVAEQGEVTGAVPLLPIQSWYFGQDPADPNHFQLPVLLALQERWEAELLAPVVAALLTHHDALRTRFEHGSDGWQQELLAVPEDGSEEAGSDLLEVHDLSDLDREAQDAAVAERSVALKASLDLETGRVFRTALFDLGPDRRQRLLLAAHHLVVDTVSLQTLVGDLVDGYRQLAGEGGAQKAVELAPKTTSIRYWAEKLQKHVEEGGVAGEESYWLAPERSQAPALPVDHPEARNLASGEETLSARLSAELTTQLLGPAPKAYRMGVQEVLLTAVAQTVAGWVGEATSESESGPVLVDLEGHGREEIFDDVDLSRTVGWFASLYPVLLDVSAVAEPKEALQTAKEQLRRIPGRGGLGWGLLATYGSEETRSALAEQPAAPLLFNYVGQVDRGMAGALPFELVAGDGELPAPAEERRPHLLEINAAIHDGELDVAWTYSTAVHDEATVRRLADSLVERLAALVEHCLSPEAGGYTPVDFPLAALRQPEIDEITAETGPVEDIYSLSPLQQGMLFHTLLDPAGGFYMAQNGHVVEGPLDLDLFRRAWQVVVDRHPALRTSFRWEGLDEPVQVVSASGEVEIQEEDWSAESAAEQQRLLDAYLEQDRRRSFALDAAPPLMRFLVAKIADRRFRIVWSLHQILFDGWSVHLIFPEFAQALHSLSRGVHPQLPQLRPYSDYIAWLREQDRSREEEYWRRVLAGMEEETPLPYDRPERGPGSRPRGHDEHTFIVDEGTWNRLQERARSLKVTVNTVVQGAWAQLLGRYSRRRDVVFGAVVAGRPPELEGVENMVGLFINTLPVRATWERRSETVEEWLQGLQEVQGELRQYEHSALADVQRWAGLPSEQSLFQTMVVFQNYLAHDAVQGQSGDLGELAIVDVDESLEHSHLPLAMVANPQQHLAISLSYDTARFDRSTVERLFGHLQRLLDELPAEPRRPVAEVPMLSEAEREQLSAWGRGEELPEESFDPTEGAFTSVPQRVAGQAEAGPDAPAVRGGAEAWSFAELARGTAAVRTALLAQGVEKGTLVGLCLHRTADLPSAMLGVLEAGCAFVPLDPDYPAERLAYMVEDSELSVVLGHGAALDGLPEDLRSGVFSGVDVLRLEDLPVEDSAEAVAVSADDLAYLIYTSGTTGKPKAVMVEHGNLAHTTSAAQQRFGLGPGDLMLCLASYSFDIFLFECLMPLAVGAAVEVVGREAILDQDALAQHVAAATRIHGVPTLLRQVVVHAKEQEQEQEQTYEKVRTVFVGGDRVPGDLVTEFEEVFPQAKIEVLYGPTEATIICSHASPERGAEHWRSLLGRPLPGVELRLLGPDGRAVPAGAPGELFIGGGGVTRGYLGRQELTDERFVVLPEGESEEGSDERFYASGDLARWIPSENDSPEESTAQLEFLGRADGQVKVRGFRVELGEVETVLRSHPALEEAAVAAVDDGAASGTRLVAYAVPAGGESMPGADELRSYCQERLAPYMVPSAFVELKELPLSPTGKVDRRALVSQAGEQAGPSAEYVAPRTEKEQALAEIFAQVLKVEQVGVHDNFFELGGDSILSIQIVGRAKRAGLRVNPAQIFEHPTVAQLAVVAQEGSVVEAEQGLVTGDAPLLPIQHLFVEDHGEHASYFNMPMLLELREEMPAEHLKKALHRLYEHHDALRLRLVEGGGGWRLHHADADTGAEAAPELERQDLSAVPDEELAAELEKAAVAVQEGLDPVNGPVFRTVLYDLGEQRGRRLFLVPHHLVMDAVSWRVLLEDLQTLLTQLKTGRDLELLPKTTSFKAWGERLTAHAASDELAAQIPYWSRSSEVTELPVDFPGGANTVGSLEMAVVTLDEEQTRILQHEVPKVYRAQIQETLLTAAAQAVLDWTASHGKGGDAVAVALEGHGREEIFDDVDLSRTVGWFTTLYPVRLAPGRGDNPGAALKAVKEQLRGVPDNGLGYGLLRYLRRDENGTPALPEGPPASLGFNYLGQLDQAMDEEGMLVPASESVGSEVHPEHTRDTVLNLEAQIYQGKLTAGWVYSQNLHRQESAEAVAEHFRRRLVALLEHVASPEAGGYTPSDFPLAALGQSELDRLFPGGRFSDGTGIEDLYPLSPTQSGMLFHTVLEPGGGHYVVQMGGELHGADLHGTGPSKGLDEERFLRAWQGVVDRHPALRSRFLWHDLERPLQAVVGEAIVPMTVLDWTSLDEEEQAEELERYLEADRRRGFDLSVTPQMRMTLMRKAPAVHQFLWSVHHITTDGWSLSAIFQEVMAFYQGLGQGAVPELPAPPRYRDYVAWLERQDLAAAEEFWRRQLADLEDPAPLRFLEREVQDETAVGSAKVQRYLPEEPSEAVQAFARRSQLTANTVIQGAWALLLARYGHARDVVFGSVVSGRPADLPGVEGMVGLFINTLPVRLRVDGEAQLVPWLKDLQERQVEMRRYEYSPLADVQRWAGLASGQQGGQPLFETIVVFENYPMDEVLEEQEAELQLKNPVNTEQTNYAVSLDATPGKQMELSAVYDPRRYEASTLERVLDHLQQLLASITEGGDRQLQELTMVTAAERSQVLEEWATAPGPAAELTVPAELLRRAEESPEAQALVSAGQSLPFGELAQQATALAHRLRALGVAAEVPVALHLERSPESVTATLAVWLAGGAFVPLDPAYPQERLGFILEDSRPKVLVSRGDLPAELAEVLPAEVERLDLTVEESSEDTSAGDLPTAAPGDLAYRIYTSGTTGRPKAVEVEHGQLAHTLAVARRRFGFAPGDTMIYAASFAFDISLFECFAPLLAGATVHLLGRDEVVDLERFAGALSQVSRVHSVPSLMRGVVGYLEAENETESSDEEQASSLRQVFLGGDRVPAELVRDVQQRFPEAQVTILYGPTEATIICAAVDLPRPYEGSRSLLGRPLDNVVLRVLDFHSGLAGVGVAGELLIGGPGVARGYLGRPELTADSFVELDGARFYKTGDLARWLPGGTLEFLGRADAQVKVRGHRIEPGEVENRLAEHPAVAEVVVATHDSGSGPELVAYHAAPEGEKSAAPAQLREFLLERLPAYMVPAYFVALDALPLSPTGKVDRRALPAPESALQASSAYQPPRTPTEETLAEIWSQLLGAERVGRGDDFFTLGGHSLLATQVASRIRRLLEVDLPLRQVFEHPTLADLGRAVDAARREATGEPLPPLVPVEREGALPLSFAQQRLWFIEQLDPDSPLYNMPLPVRLDGRLEVDRLVAALDRLVARHESLRTVFSEEDGKPVQVVLPAGAWNLPRVDLSGLGDAAEEAGLELARREAALPYDLEQGPLFRTVLVRLAEESWLLMLGQHHIISDGWSSGVLIRELVALYSAPGGAEAAELPELPVQYADYAVWQRGWLQGERLEQELDYWRGKLAQLPPLELATDFPRGAVEDPSAGFAHRRLDAELSARLEQLARDHGSTLFMVLMAGFQALLGKLAGQSSFGVGTPVAGRHHLETEGLIGFFVNTLVMRAELEDDPSFEQLLGRLRSTALDAHAHQDVPFEKLVEELAPERDLDRSPLFQVMFVLQNAPEETVELPGLELRPALAAQGGLAKFDLTLQAQEQAENQEEAVVLDLEYRAAIFRPASMDRLLEHFEILLRRVTEQPDRSLAQISLLSDAERRQVLEEYATAPRDYPRDATIAELFRRQAAATPQAPALTAAASEAGETLTYEELEQRSAALAARLAAAGIRRGDAVGVCLERSPQLIAALLAVLRAGGYYVPLAADYPAERLRFMVEDTALQVLITEESVRAQLPEPLQALDAILVDDEETSADISSEGASFEDVPCGPLDLAYVAYTSGSTGRPKGVATPHRAVVRLVREANFADLGADQVFLQLAPVSFDAATLEIWGPLLNGGRLVLMAPGQPTPETIAATLAEQGVTTLWLTAGLFHLMVDEHVEGLAPVRQLLAGGDTLSPRRVRRVVELADGPTVINGYGPTENTTFTTCWPMTTVDDVGYSVPVGRPISNTAAFVVDGHGRPVPVGAMGELWAGGDGLARGYLGRPALTAERFVPDPFGGEEGGRLYRTGDRVRWVDGGWLEFFGRRDHQVKIRGFRIELGEIEAVLVTHPKVQRAVVVARAISSGATSSGSAADKRLVAYVVPAPGGDGEAAEPTTSELRQALAEELPDYMIPAAFVILEELPLDANGKVDRKALPEPEMGSQDGAGFVAPRTQTEEVLAGIWSELLEVDRVGVHDSFFELGGHSLLATQVMSRLRSALGVEVPLRALFEAPTVEGLARQAERAQREGMGLSRPPLEPVPRDGDLPLSFAQQRLWFIHQLEPDEVIYNMPLPLRVGGSLEVGALHRALARIVARHEALRTTFPVVDGKPLQKVEPPRPMGVPLVDLSGLDEAHREATGRELAWTEASRPFDLAHGPLLRGQLVRLTPDDHLALFSTHHVVSDGWSLGVLMQEVSVFYRAETDGVTPELPELPLPELPVQYPDYAVWQRSWLQGDVLEAEIDHWRQRLAGAPPVLDLPTDRPRPREGAMLAATEEILLPPELAEQLQSLGRSHNATLFMVLLAAFQSLLARYSGQNDVSVGTPVAGRTEMEVEHLIGFFVNTLVMRTVIPGAQSFDDLVEQVRDISLEAHAHQDVPFEKLVEELAPQRDLQHSPLFQVLFSVENNPRQDLDLEGLTLSPLDADGSMAKFDLTLAFTEGEDGLAGGLEYNTDIFDGSTAERAVRHLRTLLEAAVAEPTRPVLELPLMTAEEASQLTEEWGWGGALETTDDTLHALVAASARRRRSALAVRCGEEALSYDALMQRSGAVAARLVELGAGPGQRVAVCLERGLRLVPAILGVLRTGAAYVPVDPAYPAERRKLMMDDSGCRLVVTEASLAEKVRGGTAETEQRQAVLMEDLEGSAASFEETAFDPDQLAYVIYTSGSTGRPKGVAIPHRSAAGMVRWALGAFEADDFRLSLAATSVCFDLSVFELFVPLAAGGSVRLVANALSLAEEPELADGVTLINTVPSAIRELVARKALPESVRVVNLAGEALPRELVQAIYQLRPESRVYNLYGPSEDTTYSTFTHVADREGTVTIGTPVAGSRAYVVDRRRQLVPVGVPGELLLGGAGLTRGYLGRPGLTAERYVPDAFGGGFGSDFGGGEGERLYATGDLVRWRTDGELEFLGRIDHQVKLRGFRIELGEIGARLEAQPGVHEAVTVTRPGPAGDTRLVAYYSLEAGAGDEAPAADEPTSETLTPETLREALREQLPVHMVPALLVPLDELPKTPNGKIDRRALPEPRWSDLAEGGRKVAPRTPTEQLVAEIWGELLGAETVGAHDSFFDLGGHSLLATQMVSRLRDALGVEVPLRALFDAPTVAGVARAAEEARRAEGDLAAPPLVPVPRDGDPPLSFAQQRLWFIDRMDPGSALYNMPVPMKVDGPLDVARLGRSVESLTRRHEVLRTRFVSIDETPVQRIEEPTPIVLPMVDLGGLAAEPRHQEALRLAGVDAMEPFDLEAGPLLRLSVLRLTADEHVVLANLHHSVCDGWSVNLLVQEVGVAYQAEGLDEAPPLPELPVQYADFAVWQRGWLQGEVLEAEVDYWRQELEGLIPAMELPLDRPRPPLRTPDGNIEDLLLPPELGDRLRQLSREHGATLFMTVLAIFQSLLARYSGQPDIAVGTPIAGRTHLEVEHLIGLFVNTLVLRNQVHRRGSFGSLLEQVKDTTLGAYSHQSLPFEKLVEELAPQRSLSVTPFFQVMFTLDTQAAGEDGVDLPDLKIGPFADEAEDGDAENGGWRMAKFDLTLSVQDQGDALNATLEYSTELFDPETVQRMLGHFLRLTESVTADPQRPLAEHELLSSEERAQVTTGLSPAAGEVEAPRSVPEMVEHWVERTPEAPAVVPYTGTAWSFQRLQTVANAVAGLLEEHGVGPETPVGLCLERSPELLAAMLGVLRAGAVYLPLDPAYPLDRLRYVVADAGIGVVITREGLREDLFEAAEGDAGSGAHPASKAGPPKALTPDLGTPPAEGLVPAAPCVVTGGDAAAYVLYTSGSTGRPKGVVVPHRAVVNHARAVGREYGLTERDRVLQFAAISFDVAVEEIFPSWNAGAAVVLAPPQVPTPAELTALADERGLTVANLPVSFWREWMDDLQRRKAALPESLRLVVTGSEMVPAAALPEWRELAGEGVELRNAYGLTEATVTAVQHRVTEADGERGLASVPIGRPIDNLEAYVLDQDQRPLPLGVAGELCLAGAGLARGYLGKAALTAERFVPHPLSATEGARLYRTGDRARVLADGVIEFQGRLDQQIKVRGFRVEPGEVEAALRRLPSVAEAVVLPADEGAVTDRLVGYLIADGEEPTSATLRAELAETLPSHMVPGSFVFIDEVPLTATGKVDRRRLRALGSEAAGESEFLAARDKIEEGLVEIWQEVLDKPQVGVHDNFFDLGGHSLLGVRLLSRIESRFGQKLPVATLFREPTVEGLAKVLRGESDAGKFSSLMPLKAEGEKKPLFWMHAAGGTVFLYRELAQRLDTGRPFYGLQAQGLEGEGAPLGSVESMARHYLKEVRETQAEGPYHLGGWSMGGVIAYEAARQLEAAGQEVASLVLVDAKVPDVLDRIGLADDFATFEAFALNFGIPLQLDISNDELMTMETGERLQYAVDNARRAGALPEEVTLEQVRRYYDTFKVNARALPKYKAEPYGGKILLLLARDPMPVHMLDPDTAWPQKLQAQMDFWGRWFKLKIFDRITRTALGWKKLARGGVEIQRIAGDHFTVLAPENVDDLARRLEEHLRRLKVDEENVP